MSVSSQPLDDDDRTEAAFLFAHAETVPPHVHALGHLVHAATGVLSLITDDGAWIAPPNRVAWVPAGAKHRHRAHGATDMRIVHLSAEAATGLPSGPAVLTVSPLAREALLAITTSAPRSDVARAHLRGVIVDELASAPEQPLHLPEPTDARLRRVVRRVERDLSEPVSLAALAAWAGVGGRTLTRLFRQETGMCASITPSSCSPRGARSPRSRPPTGGRRRASSSSSSRRSWG